MKRVLVWLPGSSSTEVAVGKLIEVSDFEKVIILSDTHVRSSHIQVPSTLSYWKKSVYLQWLNNHQEQSKKQFYMMTQLIDLADWSQKQSDKYELVVGGHGEGAGTDLILLLQSLGRFFPLLKSVGKDQLVQGIDRVKVLVVEPISTNAVLCASSSLKDVLNILIGQLSLSHPTDIYLYSARFEPRPHLALHREWSQLPLLTTSTDPFCVSCLTGGFAHTAMVCEQGTYSHLYANPDVSPVQLFKKILDASHPQQVAQLNQKLRLIELGWMRVICRTPTSILMMLERNHQPSHTDGLEFGLTLKNTVSLFDHNKDFLNPLFQGVEINGRFLFR